MSVAIRSFDLGHHSAAAAVADAALKQVLEQVRAGVSVLELCRTGDHAINTLVGRVQKKVARSKKGIASPTCVSVNHCVQNMSPLEEDTDAQAKYVLQNGDVVKVDLAVHIDGYIATAAHTTIVNPTPTEPFFGRRADAICAAYFGAEAAMRLIRPGNTSHMVIEAVRQAAECFACEPVENTNSGLLKRYVLHDVQIIPNRIEAKSDVSNFTFENEQVYAINVVMSTGTGKVREHTTKTGIYQRNLDVNYNLKLRSSRTLYAEITQKHPVFPFSFRDFDNAHFRVGLGECVKHGLLLPYPVFNEKSGEFVAQFKMTVVCTTKGPLRLTAAQQLPYVHSAYTLEPTSELGMLMQTQVNEAKKDHIKLDVNALTAGTADMIVEA